VIRGLPALSEARQAGGNWNNDAGNRRAANRHYFSQDLKEFDLWFRVVLAPGQP
jgi:formylglycine-generating enzyme required for sulfatase activity